MLNRCVRGKLNRLYQISFQQQLTTYRGVNSPGVNLSLDLASFIKCWSVIFFMEIVLWNFTILKTFEKLFIDKICYNVQPPIYFFANQVNVYSFKRLILCFILVL